MAGKTRENLPADVDDVVRRLHADHGGALYGWALRRFSDPRDAEEVVAEALVRAWRGFDQFDSERGSERAWLFGILRYTAADHYRRSVRHLRVVEELPSGEESDASLDLDRLAESSVVRDALMEISPQHREVIVEAFFAGRTTRQIAERLGIPAGTVKSRLYYGMRTLRTALEERGVLA